jgi:hypothetical protein
VGGDPSIADRKDTELRNDAELMYEYIKQILAWAR